MSEYYGAPNDFRNYLEHKNPYVGGLNEKRLKNDIRDENLIKNLFFKYNYDIGHYNTFYRRSSLNDWKAVLDIAKRNGSQSELNEILLHYPELVTVVQDHNGFRVEVGNKGRR